MRVWKCVSPEPSYSNLISQIKYRISGTVQDVAFIRDSNGKSWLPWLTQHYVIAPGSKLQGEFIIDLLIPSISLERLSSVFFSTRISICKTEFRSRKIQNPDPDRI